MVPQRTDIIVPAGTSHDHYMVNRTRSIQDEYVRCQFSVRDQQEEAILAALTEIEQCSGSDRTLFVFLFILEPVVVTVLHPQCAKMCVGIVSYVLEGLYPVVDEHVERKEGEHP
jgi:hypothetical protein